MAVEQDDIVIAREQVEAGVRNSITKVIDFVSCDQVSLDEEIDLSGPQLTGYVFLEYIDTLTTLYIDEVLQRFDDATDKMEVVALEQLCALNGTQDD